MAIVRKVSTVSGAWVKGSEVRDGAQVKLVSEADFIPSKFDEKKEQLTAKCQIEGDSEVKNININKPSQNALVDAFGEESRSWVGKPLTARTEKVVVSGKRVVAVYLVPEGYEMGEDANGYVLIKKIGVSEESDDVDPDQIPF